MPNYENFDAKSLRHLTSAERLLRDAAAQLIREADHLAFDAPPHSAIGIPFCNSDSLEDLIQKGTRFGTIYANPRWPFKEHPTDTDYWYLRNATSVDMIAALPIRKLAAPDSHVHIWATDRFLFDAMKIIEAWGFIYQGCLVWIRPEMGSGPYWRSSHDYMLLGARGNAEFSNDHLRSWYVESALPGDWDGRVKPVRIRGLIEQVSPGPRLELFSQTVTKLWTTWDVFELPPFEGDSVDLDGDYFGSDDDDDDEDDEDDDLDTPKPADPRRDFDTPVVIGNSNPQPVQPLKQ